MVILITGFMGVGKTTTAKLLSDLYDNCVILSFASMVKRIAFEYFGWDGNKNIRGRKLLQNIGYAGRKYNPDIWANYLLDEAKEHFLQGKIILVDDWRYINELEVISKLTKPKLIRVASTIRGGEREPNFVPDESEYETLKVDPKKITFVYNEYNDFDNYKEYLKTLHLV